MQATNELHYFQLYVGYLCFIDKIVVKQVNKQSPLAAIKVKYVR